MTFGGNTKRFVPGLLALGAAASLMVACSSSGKKADSSSSGSGTTTTVADGAVATLGLADENLVATLDPRFQSYNIEMVEVTGGEFWKPYDAGRGKVVRQPIDLSSTRLRNLAKALGPVYIRVSGSWANSTYFDVDGTSGGVPPEGFGGVLTTQQWKGVGDFAKAVDGEILTSFASGAGVRDAQGRWLPAQARALLQFSKTNGIPVVAAELFNEPTMGLGLPAGYTAQDYTRDFDTFLSTAHEVMPDLKIVGPSSTGEVLQLVIPPALKSVDLLADTGKDLNVFSYHFYPKVSARCGSKEGSDIALTQEFLNRLDASKKFYEGLRDKYAPKAPMWVTEIAQAACGGDRWASQYVDVIRYVDTLGRLGTGNGDVVFHNTLSASDYGLLDEDDLRPRPDYWAAVLWHQLMGTKVLSPKTADLPSDLAIYAHCSAKADKPSITYAVVNSSSSAPRKVSLGGSDAMVYQLTGPALDSPDILLNGKTLGANEDGTVPAIEGKAASGSVEVPPASVAFVVTPTSAKVCA